MAISGIAEAAGVGDQIGELGGLAGVGKRQDRVAGTDHAEVAMACLGGVDEERRRAGGGEGCRDFTCHVAGLAHAGDHDAAGNGGQRRDGRSEIPVQGGGERGKAVALGFEHGAGYLEVVQGGVRRGPGARGRRRGNVRGIGIQRSQSFMATRLYEQRRASWSIEPVCPSVAAGLRRGLLGVGAGA